MRKRRYIAAILAAFMTVSMTACNNKKEAKKASDESVTLKWFVPADAQPDKKAVMDRVSEITEKKIGAKLDIQFTDYGAFNTRIQAMMAAGSNFDLCFTGFMNNYNAAATKGGLLDITDMIDKDAPKLRSVIPDWMMKASEINGKIYAIPNVQVVSNPKALWVYDHIADKVDFDFSNVKKIEDIEPYLQKVKDTTTDVYANSFGVDSFYCDKYEVISSNVAIRKDGSSNKLVLIYETPEYLEGLNKLHEYYKKGYLRPDIATADESENTLLGKVSCSASTWKPGDEQNIKNAYGFSAKAYLLTKPYVSLSNTVATMTGIGSGSKYPDKALKLIELLNTDKELYNLICFGIKDKHYKVLDDGRIEYIENSGYKPDHAWKYGNQFNSFILNGQDKNIWIDTEKMNDEAIKSPLLGFNLDTTKIKNEIAQISAVSGEFQSINKGFDDPKNYWDMYVKKLEGAGQKKVLEEIQRQVDEFLKTK